MLKIKRKDIDEIRSQYNEDLFKFITPQNNDIFSNMNGRELQELLYHLENYYLELRPSLNFDPNITFGLEIELENVIKKEIQNKIAQTGLINWKTKPDSTLTNGIEINSPILTDHPNNWKDLETICNIAKKYGNIGPNCGGHIHIGKQILNNNPESWLNLFKLWSVYENIIYRFSYGEYLTARPSISRFAKPMSKKLCETYERLIKTNNLDLDYIIQSVTFERNQAINFYNIIKLENIIIPKNTIEIRCHNSSSDPIILQNNANFDINFLLYCQNPNFNHDIIDKRKTINKNKYSTLEWYQEIYLIQALELCDMIFTTNLDKLYFLRQYLKSFDIGTKELEKAKPFTKNLQYINRAKKI